MNIKPSEDDVYEERKYAHKREMDVKCLRVQLQKLSGLMNKKKNKIKITLIHKNQISLLYRELKI